MINDLIRQAQHEIQQGRAAIIRGRSRQALVFFNIVSRLMTVEGLSYLAAYLLAQMQWPTCAEWEPDVL